MRYFPTTEQLAYLDRIGVPDTLNSTAPTAPRLTPALSAVAPTQTPAKPKGVSAGANRVNHAAKPKPATPKPVQPAAPVVRSFPGAVPSVPPVIRNPAPSPVPTAGGSFLANVPGGIWIFIAILVMLLGFIALFSHK